MKPALSTFVFAAVLAALPDSPLAAESRMEKTLKLAPGGAFRLDTDLGSVTVTGKPSADVHVVVTSRREPPETVRTA